MGQYVRVRDSTRGYEKVRDGMSSILSRTVYSYCFIPSFTFSCCLILSHTVLYCLVLTHTVSYRYLEEQETPQEGTQNWKVVLTHLMDRVMIPKGLAPGEYVLGWRWDCEFAIN